MSSSEDTRDPVSLDAPTEFVQVAPVAPVADAEQPPDEGGGGPSLRVSDKRDETRERLPTADRKRDDFDAFLANHDVLPWAKLEQFGTVVAADGSTIVMHVGRHQYVRVELSKDSTRPNVGDRVIVDRNGSVTLEPDRDRDRSQTLELGQG